jgi:hypothetical protein
VLCYSPFQTGEKFCGYLEKFHLEKKEEATSAAVEATKPGSEAKTDKERKIVEASLLVFVQGIEVGSTLFESWSQILLP